MNASEFMYLDAPNCRIELRRGIVCEREFLGAAGGSATCRLLCALAAPYLEDNSVTVLAGGTGFLIEQNPDTVISPNGAVFVHRDLSSCPEDEYLAVPSDMVLETWTPSGRAEEYQERASWWLNFGVKQVWELNAANHTLTVHEQNSVAQSFGLSDTLSCDDVLPNFNLLVRRLFRDAS